uniref:Uncharacterized protein n=1 Tax=Arundo donax TaxID=35708 RepID=A0A0A9B0A0_ARUDO
MSTRLKYRKPLTLNRIPPDLRQGTLHSLTPTKPVLNSTDRSLHTVTAFSFFLFIERERERERESCRPEGACAGVISAAAQCSADVQCSIYSSPENMMERSTISSSNLPTPLVSLYCPATDRSGTSSGPFLLCRDQVHIDSMHTMKKAEMIAGGPHGSTTICICTVASDRTRRVRMIENYSSLRLHALHLCFHDKSCMQIAN